jgi:hypothetical protein
MHPRHLWPRLILWGGILWLATAAGGAARRADAAAQPRTRHNTCAGNCVVDQIFLHERLGDAAAENAFYGWYDSYYELAGCGDPAWRTDLEFLLDLAAEFAGAPGGTTMQCWQGLAGQASVCGDDCSAFAVADGRWAPNVHVAWESAEQAYATVRVDNSSNVARYEGLSELEPNAYSRRFVLSAYLQFGAGEKLLIQRVEMPSLSFPNWITRGGWDGCATQYGADDSRCRLLAALDTPADTTLSLDVGDGLLYDLSPQVSDTHGVNGSFAADGYVRLLSDNDRLTIGQGDWSGVYVVRTHNLETGGHSVEVHPWDASGGAVTIENTECNCGVANVFCACRYSETRREVDTDVLALHARRTRPSPASTRSMPRRRSPTTRTSTTTRPATATRRKRSPPTCRRHPRPRRWRRICRRWISAPARTPAP